MKKTWNARSGWLMTALLLFAPAVRGQAGLQNGLDYVARTFKTCNIIALDDGGHGNIDVQEFILKLLDSPEIRQTLDAIIVEFGSAGYQDVLDRYTSGQDVAFDELKKVWQEHGMNADGIWDKPIYFNFLKKVREVNHSLPENEKIRVLAGDPAFDWQSIHSQEDLFESPDGKAYGKGRDLHPANLAIEYGIKRGQKILIVYGRGHLKRIFDDKLKGTDNLVALINHHTPGAVQVIWSLDFRILKTAEKTKDWPLFSVLDLHQDGLGDRPAGEVAWEYGTNRATDPEWTAMYSSRKVKDNIDAFLYIGPNENRRYDKVPRELYQDDNWWAELNRRYLILWGEPLNPDLRKK